MYFSCTFATVKTKGVVKRFESSFTYTIYIREYMKKASLIKAGFFSLSRKLA